MKYRNINFLLGVVFLAFLLTACNSDEKTKGVDDNASDKHKSELKVSLSNIPPTLDPHATTSIITAEITRHVFESLVTFDENYQVQPMIADSWEVNDDYTTYTFNLRSGVTFHNGKELTAEDVIASLERWFSLNNRVAISLGGNVTLTAVDDLTVQMDLEAPSYLGAETLASPAQFGAIMPKEIVEAAGSNQVEEYIGTGPFKVGEYDPQYEVNLEKYEEYVSREEKPSGLAGAKKPMVDTIKFQFLADDSTRVASLITGEHDVARLIPYDNYDQIDSDPNLFAHLSEAGSDTIIFNKKEGVFTDKVARQALQTGLDLEALSIGTYANEQFFNLNSSLSIKEQIDWYTDVGDAYYNQNNPELARELLDESSYEGETVRILTSSTVTHRNMAITLQQQLEKLGMNTKIETLEFATLMDYVEDPGIWDIAVVDTSTEPNPTLNRFLDSQFNYFGWTNSKEIDKLVGQIRRATNKEDAAEAVDKLHEEFYDYVPVIFPSNRYVITGVSSKVENFDNFAKGMVLWNVSKTK